MYITDWALSYTHIHTHTQTQAHTHIRSPTTTITAIPPNVSFCVTLNTYAKGRLVKIL